ncbi:MAG: hypothetical protein ACI9QC_000307 [Oceanicoccus sp.]|jgi:hypothetical protein
MTILNLDIGPEKGHVGEEIPRSSKHVLNLKNVDGKAKNEAHKEVTVNLKEEISSKRKTDRICIVGDVPDSKRGLGRIPMIAGALFMIVLLNMGQLMFLGKQTGGETLALAGEAFTTMQSAGQAFISGEEGADVMLFEEAAELLHQVEEEAAPLLAHQSVWLSEPQEIQSVRALLEAGQLVTQIGTHVAESRRLMEDLPDEGSLTDYIEMISVDHLEPAADDIATINSLLQNVDLSMTDYQDSFVEFRMKFEEASSVFDLWREAKEPVLTLLGADLPQHYLILLENNDELRPGGGFIGSFAIAEVNDGRITDLDFNDVYDFDDRYFEHVEVPIHELKGLTTEWRLRDSNISVDFPTSAEYAMHFLDIEGGPGVDGVLAVNLSAAQALLEVTGELSVPSLSKSLSAATFPTVISTLVEAKVNGDGSPKNILGEFLDAFTVAAGNESIQLDLGNVLLEQMRKKQILVYHKDPVVQDFIESMGVDGGIPVLGELEEDFFMPVFTNIGANKTDRYMETKIGHDTHILEDGSMVAAVTIERTHIYDDATDAWIKSTMAEYGFTAWNEGLEKTLGNDLNETGIRLYLPEGVRFLEVQGAHRNDFQFYYDPEMDLSYYYYEMNVAPGNAESFTAFFALPWNFGGEFSEYNFSLFKQPGLKNVTYQKTVKAPNHMMLSSYPLATESQVGVDYTLHGPFNNDVRGEVLFR